MPFKNLYETGHFSQLVGGSYGPGFRVSFSVLEKVLASVVAFLAGFSVSSSVLDRVLASVPGFSVRFSVLDKVFASVAAFLAGFSVSCSVLVRVLASVLGPLSQKLQNGPDPVAAKCHFKTSTKRAIFCNLWGGPHGPGFSVSFSVLDKWGAVVRRCPGTYRSLLIPIRVVPSARASWLGVWGQMLCVHVAL